MRVIFKDLNYNNGHPYLTEIDSVSQIDTLDLSPTQSIKIPTALLFYDYNKQLNKYDKILVICTETECMHILGDLMANGWAELSSLYERTIIDPEENIKRIKSVIGKL